MAKDKFLTDALNRTEARIVALEEAMLDICTDGMVTYSVNTGQTNQSVTKLSISEAENVLRKLYNRRADLRYSLGMDTRLTIVRPSF